MTVASFIVHRMTQQYIYVLLLAIAIQYSPRVCSQDTFSQSSPPRSEATHRQHDLLDRLLTLVMKSQPILYLLSIVYDTVYSIIMMARGAVADRLGHCVKI